ncbi:MAG: hypothetical protein R6U31_00635 [bacterium]
MRRIYSFLLIILIILSVAAAGIYFVVRNELRTEKIRERIAEIADKQDINVTIEDLEYSFSFDGISATLHQCVIETGMFNARIPSADLQVDFMKLLKKEIFFNSMTLMSCTLRIDSDSIERGEQVLSDKDDIMFLSNVRMRNCVLFIDTLQIDDINGMLMVSSDSLLYVSGKFTSRPIIDYIERIGTLSTELKAVLGDSIILSPLTVVTPADEKIHGRVTIADSLLSYKFNIENITPFTLSYFLELPEEINIDASGHGNASGIYNMNDSWKSNILNIDTLTARINDMKMDIDYQDRRVSLEDFRKFTMTKRDSGIDYEMLLRWGQDTVMTSGYFNIDSILHRRLTGRTRITGINASHLEELTDSLEFTVSGEMNFDFDYTFDFDSMADLDHILSKSYSDYTIKHLSLRYDTFNFDISNIRGNWDGTRTSGTMNMTGRRINSRHAYSYHLKDEVLHDSFSGQADLSGIKALSTCTGKFNGEMTGLLSEDAYTVKLDFITDKLSIDGLRDRPSLKLNNITVTDFKHFYIGSALIRGEWIDGVVKGIDIRKENNDYSGTMNVLATYINIDSLIPISNSNEESKSPDIDIPSNIDIKVNAKCDTAVFRSEKIAKSEMTILIRDGLAQIKDYTGLMSGGSIKTDAMYYPDRKYIEIDLVTDGVEIEQFNDRHDITPYEMGGEVDSRSIVSFYQDSMRQTIAGQVSAVVGQGWMVNPVLFDKIGGVIKVNMPDTFYFEDMSGVFDIHNEQVTFEDFYMEKTGHSLIYSGNVDFDKNILIEGNYIIDLRLADTGVLERLLRAGDYEADTIGVKFELAGNYKMPAVSITENSLSGYIKNKFQDKADEFINEMKKLFSF